jgi:hypothetical protein
MKISFGHRLSFLFFSILIFACQPTNKSSEPLDPKVLEKAFDQFKAPEISIRRFGYETIAPLIDGRKEVFEKMVLGKSVEGRPINALTYGEGKRKVLLWSQMHGDESTATMALFDLFNFLEGSPEDGYAYIRSPIREELLVRFIPMLNPDGAEKFVRRNAQEIDLNRDAIRQSSPEGIILKKARDDFEPEFGFNLHDQSKYYNAKGTPLPATLSFLAPAYNEAREVNEVRRKAIKVIVGMDQLLQQVIPGQVAKYDDTFEPRAFGDNIQKWGTSTILIESGGYPGDPDKQYIRQLNFMIILNALYEIATEGYTQYSEQAYEAIPDNDSRLMDLLIKNVGINSSGINYRTDIGIRNREQFLDSLLVMQGAVVDKGDLSVYYGYEELDATGMDLEMGKIWTEAIPIEELNSSRMKELLEEGYLAVATDSAHRGEVLRSPIHLFSGSNVPDMNLELGNPPFFYLTSNGERKIAIVNGHLIRLDNPEDVFPWQLIE